MRGVGEIVQTRVVRGAPSIESDPLYPVVQSIQERLANFLNRHFYLDSRYTNNLVRVLDALSRVSVTISFLMIRHFKLRLIICKLRFKMKDEFVKQKCTSLLEFWATLDVTMLPCNRRYCDHQVVCRDWYLATLNAARIPSRPVPPYRPMAFPYRSAVYKDLWYEKHRLQLYGNLTETRYHEQLEKGPVWGSIESCKERKVRVAAAFKVGTESTLEANECLATPKPMETESSNIVSTPKRSDMSSSRTDNIQFSF